ncbi:aspartate ammonia-lyase, partial [Candidatus Woesearchaeota archaeon]|nr:aspartate ammonia-lyase [Candidatus Woesearchaeota archaeon]
ADILKIANDLRLLASGPNTAIGETILPAVEPGSSIMPGKINPSICESANMACIQVIGYDHAVSVACSAGQLELNTHLPLIGSNIIKILGTMQRCCIMLTERCIKGIMADGVQCRKNFESSGALATVLNPTLGYDKVAELVKESLKTKKTLKELVIEKNILREEEFDLLVKSSIGPNL